MLLTWLLACTPTPPPDPCAAGDTPELEIGTGEVAFEPLDDDPVMELIHGPQGGYHVLVGLSARFLSIEGTVTGTIEGSIGGEVLARAAPYLELRCNGAEGASQSWGTRLIWDSTPEALNGQEAEISATLTDALGNSASANTTALIWDPTLED